MQTIKDVRPPLKLLQGTDVEGQHTRVCLLRSVEGAVGPTRGWSC
jgi:hypothetical protein